MAIAQRRQTAEEGAVASLTGIVVSHTHWDREWYLTFELFRMRLVDTIDYVLDILDRREDFLAFTLDGQSILVEDYLAVRPEHEERIARHARSGRLLLGPWYVLSDEFLASAETLVRNLLVGRTVASRFAPPMSVGYLPDTFGHPSQIPQLLAGFGIDSAVVYRGVRYGRSEFEWESPDGTRVLSVYLPEGYCNANDLTASPHLFPERFAPTLEKLRRFATTSYVLVMNGCDHMRPRPDLEETIAEMNRRLAGAISLRQGTLAEYVSRVREAAPRLETLRGEFRSGRPSRITPGVISTRMYLKQENFRAFTTLERGAEPLSALAWLLGESYPSSYLEYAWRRLLQNTPHDSITGCSIDPVHREMMARFAVVQEVSGEILHRGAAAIAARVSAAGAEGPSGYLAINTLPMARAEHVRQRVQFLEPGAEFHLEDGAGRVVPFQVLDRRPMRIEYSATFQRFDREAKEYPVVLGIDQGQRAEIQAGRQFQRWQGEEVELLYAADLPACGYAAVRVVRGVSPAPRTDLAFGEDWAENAAVRLTVRPDGTFDVLHKRTATAFRGLGALESGGDRGDEYNFCQPEEDRLATTHGSPGELRRVESGPLRATFEARTTLRVSRELAPERRRRSTELVDIPIVTRVSLGAGRDRVEVTTELENTAQDHRLRAVFPAPLRTDVAHAQGQFTVDARSIDLPEDERRRVPEKEEEVEVATFPHRSFVDVNDGRVGLAVLNRGITEYEAERAGDGVRVCLTLLRCVGWLSRNDLWTRWDAAGSSIATPEAQCQGRYTFEYAAVPHAGGWFPAAVHAEAESYVTPVHSAAIAGSMDARGPVHSFIQVEPGELVFSALKKAEGSDALVLRFWNTAAHEVLARVRFGWRPAAVRLAALGEEPRGDPLPLAEGAVSVPVRGGEICTLLVTR